MGRERRVALVTGGSKGIGRAIAQALVRDDIDTVICGRSQLALEKAQAEMASGRTRLEIVTGDLAQEDSARSIVATIKERFGKLDILVNNAGGAPSYGDFFEVSNKVWRETFDLNVMSLVTMTREALPLLKASRSGRIVNIASLVGAQPGVGNPHYAAAKAAVLNLSKSLSNILAPSGILVNAVCPGPVHSEAWDRNVQFVADKCSIPVKDAHVRMEMEESLKIPLGRVGEGEDVAELVSFLASEKCTWMTGACLFIDGGKFKPSF